MDANIITNSLIDLAQKRPVFCSEADFQFALAEALRVYLPCAKIRLERPFFIDDTKYYHVDIWIEDEEKVYPIELKYKTKEFKAIINDENFELKDQSALDEGRYDYVADIKRIEDIKDKCPVFGEGYAIMLTNELSYINKPNSRVTKDSEFRIHTEAILSGTRKWIKTKRCKAVDDEKEGKNMNRTAIHLSNIYKIEWKEYSKVKDSNGDFVEFMKCICVIHK